MFEGFFERTRNLKRTRKLEEEMELKRKDQRQLLLKKLKRKKKRELLLENIELKGTQTSRGKGDHQGTLGANSPFFSPSTISSDQSQLGKPEILQKLPEESIIEAPTTQDGIPSVEGKAEYDKRFKLILETFHNLGEIMLFEESELVVTDPRHFTQELVKNIVDHDILNKSISSKPREIQNILYKGIFNKNSFEGEDANKYWSLLKATGLGVELTPLSMFIPLLFMEHTSQEIESAAVQFRAGLEQSNHKFACRYDVLNIAGNGIDFFHELTKVIFIF